MPKCTKESLPLKYTSTHEDSHSRNRVSKLGPNGRPYILRTLLYCSLFLSPVQQISMASVSSRVDAKLARLVLYRICQLAAKVRICLPSGLFVFF